uniref:Programmed cell death protein 7 n=1 Tax=Clastoptera arizonana TaxID=38151 RepID=A0A1B6CQH6_9HEMI
MSYNPYTFRFPPPFNRLRNPESYTQPLYHGQNEGYRYSQTPTIPTSPLFSGRGLPPPRMFPSRYTPPQQLSFINNPRNQYSQQSTSFIQDNVFQSYSALNSDSLISSEDQIWIKAWLKKIGKLDVPQKKVQKKCLQIHEMKNLLSTIINITKELENASLTLNVMIKSVNDKEWDQKCSEVESKKKELSQLLQVLKMNSEEEIDIKKKIKKRNAKRNRLKRQRLRMKAERLSNEENRKKLHDQIDSWLDEMRENVERVQREENLKREADSVLWEVNQKKSDARKQINLLSALLKLREAKVTALKSSGKYVSESEVSTFNIIIDKLKSMWERQLDGYLKEEQGLKVMLSEDDKANDDIKYKHFLNEWEVVIFGKCNDTSGEPVDLEEFLEVRRTWDQYVTNEKSEFGSTIPFGWVLPSNPSDELWAKCLKNPK